ncbi:MAG TPA: hypothetical protein VHZ78_04595 [Rhizomicrobium sp.]|jgi:hypothetical protein|nr:hypothetical protein [Rhizomicrobium sp.]
MTDYNQWLSESLNKYGSRTLKELVLPGSHDSGMYSPHFCMRMGGPSTTKTQNDPVSTQLANGCRFFDIRVVAGHVFNAPGGDYYTHHSDKLMGCLGESIDDVLGAIRGFLQSHAELVILKLSHFEEFSEGMHTGFLGIVESSLSGCLPQLPESCKLAHVPLRRLLARSDGSIKGTAIVLHSDLWGARKSAHSSFFLCRDQEDGAANQAAADIVLFDKYSNSSDAETVMSGQIKYLLNQDIPKDADKAAGNHQDRLFLVSWTITEGGFNQALGAAVDTAMSILENPWEWFLGLWGVRRRNPPRHPNPQVPAIVWDAGKVNDHMDRILNAVPANAIAQNVVPNLIYVDAYNSAAAQMAMRINDKLDFRQPRTGMRIGESLELGDWLPSADHAVILKLESDGTLKLKDMRGTVQDIFSLNVPGTTKVMFEEGGRLSAYGNGERLAYLSRWVGDKVGWLEIASGGHWQSTLDLWSESPQKGTDGAVTNDALHLGTIETAAECLDWPSDALDHFGCLRRGGRMYSRFFDYFLQFDGNDGSLRLYDQRREYAFDNQGLILPRVEPVVVCTLWSGSQGDFFVVNPNDDLVILDKDRQPIATVLPCPPRRRDNNPMHSVSGAGRLFVSDEGRVFFGMWDIKQMDRGAVWLKAWPSNDILLSGQTLVPPNKLVHGGMEMAFDADNHLGVTYDGRLLYYFGPEANMTANPVPVACAAVDCYGQLNVYGTTGTPKPLANLEQVPLPEFEPPIYSTNERNNLPQYMFLNDYGRLQFNDGHGVPVLYVEQDRAITLYSRESRFQFPNSEDIRTRIPVNRWPGLKKGEFFGRGEFLLSGTGMNMLSLGGSGRVVLWDAFAQPPAERSSVKIATASRLQFNQDGRLAALDAAGTVVAFLSKAASNATWLSIADDGGPAILLWDKQPVWARSGIQNGAVVVERISDLAILPAS